MQIRILLAEDEEIITDVFKRILEPISSRIIVVDKLSDCLRIAESDAFDVILLDLTLKDSGRDETLDAIATLKATNSAPVVVVTGSVETDIRERAFAAGADYFVGKASSASHHTPLLLAIQAATVNHPQSNPTESFTAHVEMLERLCHT